MGARFFETEATGISPDDAYRNAITDAMMEHGLGGYTGTIIETAGYFVTETQPDPDHPDIQDKWDPCACTPLGHDRYLFWGWASE